MNNTSAPLQDLRYKPVVCFDVDGTLLDLNGNLHPFDRALLYRPDLPAMLVATTGRPINSFYGTLKNLGLEEFIPFPYPMVLQNGTFILDAHEKELVYLPFTRDEEITLLSYLEKYPHITFMFQTKYKIFRIHRNEFGDYMEAKYDFDVDQLPDDAHKNGAVGFSKVMAISANPEELEEIVRAAHNWQVEGSFSMPEIYELSPLNKNKSTGVKLLVDALGIKEATLLAAGDGGNDLALLHMADRAFIPSHSSLVGQVPGAQIIDTAREGIFAPMLRYCGFGGYLEGLGLSNP